MSNFSRFSKIIYSVCGFFVVGLVITLISSSAQLIHFRMEIANYQNQIESLVSTRETLENQLSQSTAIFQSKQLAEHQGFVSIDKTVTLQIPNNSTVALR